MPIVRPPPLALDEGVELTRFSKLNFTGPGTTAVVDPIDEKQINLVIPGATQLILTTFGSVVYDGDGDPTLKSI